MNIIIVGAVAAGTSAAAKARRNHEDAVITVYEKDRHISYSGCGMPYYLAGEMENFTDIIPRDPAFFKDKYNVDIHIRHEVLNIDPTTKTVTVKNLDTDAVFDDNYDVLVIATGARAVQLPVAGADLPNVCKMKNPGDTQLIDAFIKKHQPKRAVVIGSGFVGLEMTETLTKIGLQVTIIEKMTHLNPVLDEDMSHYIEKHLKEKQVRWLTSAEVEKITSVNAGSQQVPSENEQQSLLVYVKDQEPLETDMVLTAVGIRPEVELARQAGLALGITGAIKTDARMATSDSSIYACGDCVETYSVIDGQPLYKPLGSTANKTGRIAGDVITGGTSCFRGIAGTGIFRLFDLTVASTGLSENEAVKQGYTPVSIINIKPDRPNYMGGKQMVIKAVADKASGRLLGAQIVGYEGVDKRIDVFATTLFYRGQAADLADLDLAYAPPYATTKDPVIYTGMILDNALNRGRELVSEAEIRAANEDYYIIDTRPPEQYAKGHVRNAINIPHAQIREKLSSLPKDKKLVTYCNRGTTGNAVQNILINRGFKSTRNLSGGHKNYCCQNESEASAGK